MKKQNLELKIGKGYTINDMDGIYTYGGADTLEGFKDNKGKESMFHVFVKEYTTDKKTGRRLQVNIYEDSPITIKNNHATVPEENKIIAYTDLKTKWCSPLKSSLNPSYFNRFREALTEGGKLKCHKI